MTDLFSSTSSFDAPSKPGGEIDKELQEFLVMQNQKAQLNARVHEFSAMCWDKCMDKPGNKLDSRTETCLSNCVNRFLDVSLMIANRFAQMVDKS